MDAGSAVTLFLICCSSFIGPRAGVFDGELNYCPPTPNCVSSQSWKYNVLHNISPFHYKGTQSEAIKKLVSVLDAKENVKVMEETDSYVKVYFFTKVFRFPDRVEFLFTPDSDLVQIRSSSTFGIFDFFHNRIRMELLRRELEW